MPTTTEILRYDPTNNAVVPVKDRRRRRRLGENDEYTTKKKVEVKTTTNTERRIQRQVVLEDGRVLAKNDPEIIVDRVEDTETRETDQTHDDIPDTMVRRFREGPHAGKNIVKDSFRRTVNTRDVTENVKSTRVSKDLGVISKKALKNVLKNKSSTPEDVIRQSERLTSNERQLAPVENVTTYEAESHKKIVDTTDIHDVCHLENGKLKSETYKTETHEIYDDRRVPSDGTSSSGSKPSLRANDIQKYTHTKTDNFTDYYKDEGGNMRKIGSGANNTSENRNLQRGMTHDWSQTEDKIRRNRRVMNVEGESRHDVVTKKPLNFVHEEKARRKETNKWLEEHFGSDWSLSNSTNSSNKKKTSAPNQKTIRRTMSFSSVQNPNMSRLVKQTTTTYNPVSGEEKVTYATMSRIDPRVNTSTLSLPITRVDVSSSSSSSNNTTNNKRRTTTRFRQENEDRIRSESATPLRRNYSRRETENSNGTSFVTNFRANPRTPSSASSSAYSEIPRYQKRSSLEEKSGSSPPLIHDRVQRLRTEHSSRSRNKKMTSSSKHRTRSDEDEPEFPIRRRENGVEDTRSFSSSTSRLHQVGTTPSKTHTMEKSTQMYRSKSSQPMYRTELRREQYYPLESTLHFEEHFYPKAIETEVKTAEKNPNEFSSNSTTKYIHIEPRSYRTLERSDGVESPSAFHDLPLRKFISEERTHNYDKKNEIHTSTPIRKSISKPNVSDTLRRKSPAPPPRRKQFREPTLEGKVQLRNHYPDAEYMSPRKHMERSESEQHHYRHHTHQKTSSRSVSNRPKQNLPDHAEPAARTLSRPKKHRGNSKTNAERTHSFLVKSLSSGSNEYSRKVYHEHPLVQAEVQRLDNSYNEKLLSHHHTNNFGKGGGGGGGGLSGLLGKLSPHRRSVSTAKLNQISSNTQLNKFGGSVRDLYFASSPTGSSPTARSFYETNDAQKFKTIIFLSGK